MVEAAIPPADIRRLSSGRWLVPIMALMSMGGASRFGVLARKLGVSRSVLAAQLELIERFGWMVRNLGHGHPLRPEYLLTTEGRAIGAWCERLMEQRQRFAIPQTGLGRWSLPLLLDLGAEPKRFKALQQALSPVTPRALSFALQQLQQAELVAARVPLYDLSSRGRLFAKPLFA